MHGADDGLAMDLLSYTEIAAYSEEQLYQTS